MYELYNITKNHYDVALEHIELNPTIKHTPTIFQALRMTITDLLLNNTIYDNKTKSHLVYEVIKVPTLGLRTANVIRMYVPKQHRGCGIMSKMLDSIPEHTVLSARGDYGEVGRLCISRINI